MQYFDKTMIPILGPLKLRLSPASKSKNIRYKEPMPKEYSVIYIPMVSPKLPVIL